MAVGIASLVLPAVKIGARPALVAQVLESQRGGFSFELCKRPTFGGIAASER